MIAAVAEIAVSAIIRDSMNKLLSGILINYYKPMQDACNFCDQVIDSARHNSSQNILMNTSNCGCHCAAWKLFFYEEKYHVLVADLNVKGTVS